MRRVELIGPPGVGKTTVLKPLQRALEQRRREVCSPRQVPLMDYHQRHGIGGLRRGMEAGAYRLKGLHRWMRPKLEKELTRHAFRGLREAAPPWPAFIRLALQQGEHAADTPALALERLRSFMDSAALTRAADNLPGEAVVLFDEGLGQRGVSLGQHATDEDVLAYYRLMPPPDAVVLLVAPTEVIQQRLRERNPSVTRFHTMVERALRICELAAQACPVQGVPVLTVDATGAAGDTAARLAEELDAVFAATASRRAAGQSADASGSGE